MNYQLWQEISFCLTEIDKEKLFFEKNDFTPELVARARQKIAGFFEELRPSLEQKLDKDHSSPILFALVAAVDEEMQKLYYNSPKIQWNPLQKDFFSGERGGEVFFERIDDILDKHATPPIVYEAFYFMLKRGFQGKYRDSKTHLLKYAELLQQKIPVKSPPPKNVLEEPVSPYSKKERMKKKHYYTIALALFVVTYIGLYFLSNFRG